MIMGKRLGKEQFDCPDIYRKAADWAVVSVSTLYGASAAA